MKDKKEFIQNRLNTYHFLNDGVTFILPTLMASLFIIFELNWFQAGLIFAFNTLALVLAQIVVGYYTDKYPKGLMKIGLFLLFLSTFIMIFAFDFISLLIFAILSGIATGFQHSITYSTASKMFKEDIDTKLGRLGAAGDFGKFTAVFSSTLLILFFLSWQIVLIVWSLFIFSGFLIIVYNFKKIKFDDYFFEVDEINDELILSNENNANKTFITLIIVSYIVYSAIFAMIITNLATYLRVEKKGLVSEYSGLILGFTIVFGAMGAYFSGFFKEKLGISKLIILISIILIFIFQLYLYLNTSNLFLTLFFFGIIGFLLYIIYPQILALTNKFTPSHKRGFAFGIVLSLGWFGSFLGALIGGYFANLYSASMFFILGSLFFIVLIVLSIIMKLIFNLK